MKKVMMTIAVVVVLMGIPGEAVADVWSRCGLRSSRGFQLGGRRFLGGSFRTPLGSFRTPYGNVWNRCGLPSRGGFAYYGRDRSTLGEVLDCVGSGMNVLGGLNQMSVTNRLVDHQISVDNRMVSMAERDQDLRDQQIRAQARTQRKTVLVITDPVIYVPAGCRVKEEPEKTQENEKLRQEVEVKKESKDERLLEIISELKSYKGAYCEYLQKRHENKSPEDALKAALEKLKDSDEEAYYKLLEKMYDCGN